MVRKLLATALIVHGGACWAGERITLKVEGGGAAVSISKPDGWTHRSQPASPMGQTVRMSSASGKSVLLVTAMPGKAPDEEIGKFVEIANDQYVAGSVEQKCVPTKLRLAAGEGAYCAFTEARLAKVDPLPPGEFRNVTAGLFRSGTQLATFTLLSNNLQDSEYQAGIKALGSFVLLP